MTTNEAFLSKVLCKRGREKDYAINTYGISYAGHLDFGDAIAQQVHTVGVSAGSYPIRYGSWPASTRAGEALMSTDYDDKWEFVMGFRKKKKYRT